MRRVASLVLIAGLVLAMMFTASTDLISGQASPPVATPCLASPVAGTPGATPADRSPSTSMGTPANSPCAATARTIKVEAASYKFTPNTFDLKVGQPVTFVITSADIFHTFTVKKSEDATENIFSVDIQPGETVSYTFTPEETGDLYLYCIPHAALGMVGSIHVGN